ncbi:uncharacterized protein J3D65DRAFT_398589 [Phyllosticta citribraziliensis]|uniref:Uncharacterized protein n=1 Tax=Phyllosticta citribraziliensis TaxID=989973 RepID=A0ABR1LMM5_9PEZI
MAASESLLLTPCSCQSVDAGLHRHFISARRYNPSERALQRELLEYTALPCEVFELLQRSIQPHLYLALPSTSQELSRGIRPYNLRLLDFQRGGAVGLQQLRASKSSLSFVFALDAKPLRSKPSMRPFPLVQTLESLDKSPEHLPSVHLLSAKATKSNLLINCLSHHFSNEFTTGRLAQLVRAWC